MKYILYFLFLVPTILFAQKKTYTLNELVPIDSTTGDIVYEGIIDIPGVSAADLYSRAKTFYLKTFNNANAVIQADEKDKRVGGKGVFILPTSRKPGALSGPYQYNVTIDIQVKDDRYRYEFSQFSAQFNSMPIMRIFKVYGKSLNEKAADQIRVWDEGVQARISQLQQYMSGKIGTKDW